MRYLAAGAVVGRYRIEGLLGRGGMATVYSAVQESLGRQVALKLLDPGLAEDRSFVERFRREGQLQASLEHPHVVTVFEAGEADAGLFLAMQLIRGPTLATLVASGALTGARTVALLDQIAAALDAAHAAGLIHRDVKPRNVLVGEGDHAYLTDFGLSKLGSDTGLTVTGAVVGTLAYLAPEVIHGHPATPAADRYAFAALAFECLTGSVVFPRATQAAQLYAHTSEPVPSIANRRDELPAALDAVFERALAKEPGARPATAAALVAEIRAAIGAQALAALPPPAPLRTAGDEESTTGAPVQTPAPRPVATPPRRRAAGMLVAGLLAGAAVGAGVAILLDDDDDAPATSAAAAVFPPLPGTTVLGADLEQAGETVDCRGGEVTAASVACSLAQDRLPGATIVAPQDGIVRRWAVRSASGELQLQALRPRDKGFFQLAVSRSEFVPDSRVHAFRTNLVIEAGDVLSVKVVSGSGVGIDRGATGGTTHRWIPRLRGIIETPEPGPDGALLLRAELEPQPRIELPPAENQVRGVAAARLPDGKVLETQPARLRGGPSTLKLVAVDDVLALDLFRGERRIARTAFPDFPADLGTATTFEAYSDGPGGSPGTGIFLEYRRDDSDRLIAHFIYAVPSGFTLSNYVPDIDGFRVESVLGEGPRGRVFVATQASLGRRVALKAYHGPGPSQPWPEHPGVARLYAAGQTAAGGYTAAQLCTSLHARIAAGDIGRREALALCDEIAATLAALGVPHGAISPTNILVDADGRALLCDFGMPGVTASATADQAALAAIRERCATLPADRGRPARRWVVLAAAVASVCVGAGAVLLASGGEDGPPSPLPGTTVLGSALDGPAPDTVACGGRPPDGNTLPCTIVQTRRGGRPLRFGADGVLRRWAVRGATGSLELVVVHPTDDGFLATQLSGLRTVRDSGPVAFRTALPVQRGDLIGIEVRPDAGVGIQRGASGAATMRFSSPLRPGDLDGPRTPEQGPGTGFDHPIELRVEYEPD